jgi:hypothetical protein
MMEIRLVVKDLVEALTIAEPPEDLTLGAPVSLMTEQQQEATVLLSGLKKKRSVPVAVAPSPLASP